MSETQRLIWWVLSNSATTEVNLAMQEFSAISYETSEQHKDISASNMTKGVSNTHKMGLKKPIHS